jgi:hypothetical protein
VKTLVTRALKYSPDWASFNSEVKKLEQSFANCNYPQAIVENIVKHTLDKYHTDSSEDLASSSKINYFVQLTNLSTIRQDQKLLRSILRDHVKPSDDQKPISLTGFYKPYKLSSLFSTRPRKISAEKTQVVYRFNCPVDGCNASYIGHTTCTLERRSRQHRYSGSSIHRHFTEDHQSSIPDTITDCFSIMFTFSDRLELRIAEAIAIRQSNPFINVKYQEMSKILNLYR